jgi:hypothetical protein
MTARSFTMATPYVGKSVLLNVDAGLGDGSVTPLPAIIIKVNADGSALLTVFPGGGMSDTTAWPATGPTKPGFMDIVTS